MSILANAPRGTDAELDAALAAQEGQFSRGLRSGTLSMRGQLSTLSGAVGGAMGNPDWEASELADAAGLNARAAEAAPRVGSFRDVRSLRDAGDYTAGLLGQATPSLGLSLGAATLTGGAALPAIAAGTLVNAPFAAGDVLQRQQSEGRPMSLREAVPTALASSAVENIVPGLAAAKLTGKMGRGASLRSNLATIPESAAGEGAAEFTRQVGSGQDINTDAIIDNAVGGAVVGVPLAAVGAVGSGREQIGKAVDAVKEAPGRALEAVKGSGATKAVASASQEAADGLAGLYERGKNAARSAVDQVEQGLPAGDLKSLGALSGDAFSAALAKMDGETLDKVKGWADGLAQDAGLTPERRQALTEAMKNLGDEASQRTVAGLKRAQDMGRTATEAVSDLHKTAAEWFAGKDVKGTVDAVKKTGQGVLVKGIDATTAALTKLKKSEDFSGTKRIISEHLIPALKEVNPAVLDKAENVNKLAEVVGMFMESTLQGKAPDRNVMIRLGDVLGDKTTDVLDRVHRAVYGEDRSKAEQFFGSLNQMREGRKTDAELHQTLTSNLRPELQGTYTTREMRELADHLKKWVRRVDDGTEAERFHAQRVIDELKRTFVKPDAVLAAIEKQAKADEAAFAKDAVETDENGDPINADGVDYTDVLTESGPRQARVSDKLMTSPEVHRAEYGNEGQAERSIREAKARDAGLEARWVSAAEWHAENGGEAPADKNLGYVVAERMPGSDKLSAKEAAGFKFDSSKGDRAANRSVIDAGEGMKLDAMKLGRQRSGEELPWNAADDKGSMVRLSRQFLNNVAALQEHLGRSFEIPDTAVVARRGKLDITAGELKKLTQSTESRDGRNDEAPADKLRRLQKELAKVELAIVDAEPEARKKLLPEWRKLKGQVEQLLDVERVQRGAEARGIAEPSDERMSVQELDALGALDEHRTNMDGTPVSHTPRKTPRERLAQQEALTRNKREPVEKDLSAPKEPPSPKALAAKKAAFLEKARSGDAELLKTLASSDDAKGLQRAAEALKGEKGEGAQRTVETINKRLTELLADPDTAYGMQTQAYSLQGANPAGTSTSSAQADALAHINAVLGPTVQVAFKRLLHAGEFEAANAVNPTDLISISVHALDPRSVAYHESLHAWFKQLGDKGLASVMKPLQKAADSTDVRKQLERLLAGEPAALKQLSDPEERVAYMYQFWASGDLKLGGEPKNVLQKIADLIREVLGIWSNDERALHTLDYFHSGEYAKDMSPAAVTAATVEKGHNAALAKAKAMTAPLTRMADTIVSAGSQRLRDTGIPALRELANLVKATGRDGQEDAGFIPAARAERTLVMNRLAEGLKPYSAAVINEALEASQRKLKAASLEARTVQRIVSKVLSDSKDYMQAAGVNVGDLGPDYFPRVYDASYIARHQKEFITLLEKYGVDNPERTMHKIVSADGNEFQVETMTPGMQHLKERKLDMVPDDELAPFMRKDLFETMNSYVTQATRRAEWSRRFRADSSLVRELMMRAAKEGASKDDITYAENYLKGVDGTLGDTMDPQLRRLTGSMIVYQNIRLLPLAIFSSVVDPVGIMVRGGSVGDAFTTLKRGVKETVKNFQKAPGKDSATDLAELLGTIDNAALMHTLGATYSQGMVGDTGRKINDAFFRFNLMEQFNSSMRVGATQAALSFIAKHGDGTHSKHSARWMAELGLDPSSVQLKADGSVKLFEHEGLTAEQAGKMRMAVNRWVDGAVLRPDAADKPVWMNDPRWALIAHLKQFVYSFHETILKRVAHEAQFGNYSPAMALASYVPIMIASDMAKGLIQGGGEQPDWKDGWGPADYVWSGVQRAGLLGTGQFVADMATDISRGGTGVGALSGPTIEQLTNAVQVLGGREQFGNFAIKSLPANALYAAAAKGEATDPMHTG